VSSGSTAAAPVLRCEELTKRYVRGIERHHVRHLVPGRFGEPRPAEAFDALRSISFTMRSGDALGIVGPNGAGKSTLLKVVAGLTPPSQGRICLRGRVASIVELGVGFHPDLTGAENVQLTASLYGVTPAELSTRMAEVEAFAGIGDALDTPVKWYSTGMLARLGFALAVHLDAEVLVVDEVLSVGDEEFRQRCLEKLAEVRERGVTLLLVSHDLVLVDRLCDRVLHLERGVVVDDGPAHEVLDRYAGEGASSGRTWAGAPAALHGLAVSPSVIAPGDPFSVRAEVEVRRALDRLIVDVATRPRLPGVDLAPHTETTAVHSTVEVRAEHRGPGRVRVEAEVESLPLSGGVYECVLSLLDEEGAVPLAEAKVLLKVDGPTDHHAMVTVDGHWDLVRVGDVPGTGS
jgi:ABC-type polysaccharide/polyol phosphate transport system ATPase subunit